MPLNATQVIHWFIQPSLSLRRYPFCLWLTHYTLRIRHLFCSTNTSLEYFYTTKSNIQCFTIAFLVHWRQQSQHRSTLFSHFTYPPSSFLTSITYHYRPINNTGLHLIFHCFNASHNHVLGKFLALKLYRKPKLMNHILYSTPLNHENTYLNTIILAFDSLSNRTNFHDRLFIMLNILCRYNFQSCSEKEKRKSAFNLCLPREIWSPWSCYGGVFCRENSITIWFTKDWEPKKVNATKKNGRRNKVKEG